MPMDMHNQAIQRNWQVQFKRQAKEQNNENMQEAITQTLDAFHFAKLTNQKPVELSRENGMTFFS